jgi:hypothetical protein
LLLPIICALPTFAVAMPAKSGGPKRMSPPVSAANCDLRTDMRKLWEDHVTWTRTYVISAVAGLDDKSTAAERLLQNQTDIGNAIKPFYGDAAGTKLTALLRDHILIATEVVDAAKAGDAAKKADATKRWTANADEIAAFLSTANPANWPAADMKTMMRDHLDKTTAEVVARLKKDWPGDVKAYDAIHAQALEMADMLTSGIAAQFPERVTTAAATLDH